MSANETPKRGPGSRTCSCDRGFTAQPAGRRGEREAGPQLGWVWGASLSPLGPWNPPRAGSSPRGPEAAQPGEVAPWLTPRGATCPRWVDGHLCQLFWPLGWFQAGLWGATACVRLRVGDRFSNKGPASLLCWSTCIPASACPVWSGGRPPARQPPAQVGTRTTPGSTHGWWPAGLGLCLSVPVAPPRPLPCVSSLGLYAAPLRAPPRVLHRGPQPPQWLWPSRPLAFSPEVHTHSGRCLGVTQVSRGRGAGWRWASCSRPRTHLPTHREGCLAPAPSSPGRPACCPPAASLPALEVQTISAQASAGPV